MVERIPAHLLDPAGGTDGQGLVISGGKVTIGDLPGGLNGLVPLTTEIGGVPAFVWDANNQLVMTEASQ